MRPQILLAVICGAVLAAPVSPASAARLVEANVEAIIWAEGNETGDGGAARVIVGCYGRADDDAARTEITCELFDSSGRPPIVHRRSYAGPVCVCGINAFNIKLPLTYCATVTATFTDSETGTDRVCETAGIPAPPQNPGTPPARILGCLDLVGAEAAVENLLEVLP